MAIRIRYHGCVDALYQDCTMLHVDADGFFAAVEQALDPALRGRPVVTGSERGIIAAASYEAKARGVKRGIQLHEARRLCPELVILPSDYETYGHYSNRLFAILRRFTPLVEEYSIDEAFADLSGCGALLACPLEEVAAAVRRTVARELGVTVSVGISLTKTLAKLCSKFRKPDGQTIVRREHLPLLLRRTPIAKVWGIGAASAAKFSDHGILTALDFARMEAAEAHRLLHKPGYETWRELRGARVFPLQTEAKARYDSMMKGHTFSPPSDDPRLVYAEALHNLGAALAKLRRHAHLARELGLSLRCQDYSGLAASVPLAAPTCHDCEFAPLLRRLFEALFERRQRYRATLIWLGGLIPEQHRQLDLFDETPRRAAYGRLDQAVDRMNRRYGRDSVAPATLLNRRLKPVHARDAAPARYGNLARGETIRHLAIPRLTLGIQV
ncbi:MAG: DNA polymerase IV [Kiritimatiellae bacterium]|nr:DNA polymerase IV [Kiritimatiellia bacterium]